MSPSEYAVWKANRDRTQQLRASRRQFKVGKKSRKSYMQQYYLVNKERMKEQIAAARAARKESESNQP